MATAAISATNIANDDLPQIAGEIIVLDPREVVIGERLRAIDTVWAGALGKSMRRDGQIHPIEVCRIDGRWHLAGPGGHRLTGAIAEGLPIEAKEVSSEPTSRRRREAVENIFRRDNDPIERAAAIAELVYLHKVRVGIDPKKAGRAISADARWQKVVAAEADDATATIAVAYGWTDHVAAEIGFSPRTVRDDLMLYRRLPPSLVAQLRASRHPILSNASQLRTLAKLDSAEKQTRAVDMLVSGEARAIGDAVKMIEKVRVLAPEDKRQAAILGTLARMSATERTGLFQSPAFHDLIPAEARRLLAPMLRKGGNDYA